MAKVGRPSKYDKDFHPQDFLRLANSGKVLSQIAREWKVDRQTINDWAAKHKEFSRTLKMGKEWAEAWWMNMFQHAAIGLPQKIEIDGQKVTLKFNAVPAIWLTKNAFGWADSKPAQDAAPVGDRKFKASWGGTSEPGSDG